MCTQMKVNNSGSTFVSLVVKSGHLLRKLVGRGGLFTTWPLGLRVLMVTAFIVGISYWMARAKTMIHAIKIIARMAIILITFGLTFHSRLG